MKITYKWLKEFVDIKVSPLRLAEDLSLFGHSVESITSIDDDYILDLEITANRGDCLSVLGIAREVAALYKLKNKNLTRLLLESEPRSRGPARQEFKITSEKINRNIKVNISDANICPRFTARIIDNIKIGESPKWMQDRLRTVGIRPLNNIVDVTNYVMIETGQPLHAFDYDKIHDGKMNIRIAQKNEIMETLDEKTRQLGDHTIIIEDSKKIFDLPGIMGGKNSEVDKNTKTIILQGAIFDPVFIRRTSKRLKLRTEASYRYEHGVDLQGTIYGINRAGELINKLCSNAKIGELIDIKSKKNEAIKIKFTPDKINKLLGTGITAKEMIKFLDSLGFQTNQQFNNLTTQPPSYRQRDVTIWQDLAEEIARVYGYNKLRKHTPVVAPTSHRDTTGQENYASPANKTKMNKDFVKKETIKDLLAEKEFTEVYSYPFADKRLLKRLGYNLHNCRRVINGLTPETEYLRPSLLPSLLTAVAKNPWAPEVRIFEIGKVFDQPKGHFGGGRQDSCEVGERWQLGVATTGKSDQEIKKILETLNIQSEFGTPKMVDQGILDFLKIRRPVKYAIFDLDKLSIRAAAFKESLSEVKYKPISQFAPTVRDLAFIVDKKINAEKIKTQISRLHPQILLVELFDEFASDKFGKNKKNIAYHVWLQDLKCPMKENEVNKITNKIVKAIEQKFNARLRS